MRGKFGDIIIRCIQTIQLNQLDRPPCGSYRLHQIDILESFIF